MENAEYFQTWKIERKKIAFVTRLDLMRGVYGSFVRIDEAESTQWYYRRAILAYEQTTEFRW